MDESLYMLCGEKLAAGATLYNEIWVQEPPLLMWFYGLFSWLFGRQALLMIRIFTCFYVYFIGVYLGALLVEYRMAGRYKFLSPVLTIFLLSVPWFAQELSAELFMLFPLIVAFYIFVEMSERKKENYLSLMWAGFLLTLCLLVSFQAFFLFLAGMLLFLAIRGTAFDELIVFIGGGAMSLGLVVLALYYRGNLTMFKDLVLLYSIDSFWSGELGAYEGFGYRFLRSLVFWGGFLGLAILGFFHFRIRFFSYVKDLRLVETAMAFWLMGAVLCILFVGRGLDLHHLALLAIPVSFYTNHMLTVMIRKNWQYMLLAIAIVLPIYAYWGFFQAVRKDSYSYAAYQREKVLFGDVLRSFRSSSEIVDYFSKKDVSNGIWIMAHRPDLYYLLDADCSNKYIDFRISWHKFESFPYRQENLLVSNTEYDDMIYEEFIAHTPDYIVDPHGYFSYLQDRFPTVFDQYDADTLKDYMIYKRGGEELADK